MKGFYEIYVNTEIDDKSDIAELMKIYSSPNLPENSKFPRTCEGIKNLKVGKGRDNMCAIVEEYAKEQAKQMALRFLRMGKLSVEEIAEGIPSLSVEEIIELQESVLQTS